MGKVISIANQKGGVGKTTTSVNLAGALGLLEKRILLIDADPQANATSGLGLNIDDIEYGTYQVLSGEKPIDQTIIQTEHPNVWAVPSHIDLVAAEIELVDVEQREYKLREHIQSIRESYDYIFIDCAPSLGLTTLNALVASDSVLIPIQCEYYALEGLGKLLNTIKSIQKGLNKDLDIEGMLLTMYDGRTNLSKMVVDEVRKHFENIVFNTIIQRNVKISEAPSYGRPITSHDIDSPGSVGYISLANEILERNKK